MFKLLGPILFAAGISIAGEAMCERLCEPCRYPEPEDATCANVVEVCKCAEVFDSLEAAAAAKISRNEARGAALGNLLYEECKGGKCASTIWFEGAELRAFKASEAGNAPPAKEPAPKPLAAECAELCGVVAEEPGNAMAEQIEASCGCSAHVQDSLKLVEFRLARLAGARTSADSVVKLCEGDESCKVGLELDGETFGVASIEKLEVSEAEARSYKAARRAALGNSLHEACLAGKCRAKVGFEGSALKEERLLEAEGFEAVPEPEVKQLSSECAELCEGVAEEPGNPMAAQIETSCRCQAHAQASAALEAFRAARIANSSLAADSVVAFCAEREVCNVEVLLKAETFELESLELAAEEEPAARPRLAETEATQARNSLEPKEAPERKRSYFGFTLFSDFVFESKAHLHNYRFRYEHEFGYGGGLGFVYRFYFIESSSKVLWMPAFWASFQTGLNAAYNLTQNDFESKSTLNNDIGYNYYSTISAEVPLQLRLGVPFVYGTFMFTARKPVWEDLYLDRNYLVDRHTQQFLGINYWGFMLHAGFGLELTKHFSVEWLFLLSDNGTHDLYLNQEEAWRAKMDFAW